MEDGHHRQRGKTQRRAGEGGEIHRHQVVNEHHHGADAQLHHGGVVGGDVFELLAAKDDEGVQHRRAQTQSDAGQVQDFAAHAALHHAGHQEHAAKGQGNAAGLQGGQLFLQQQGREQQNDDGGEIVAQRGHRHGGVAIGLKEEDPVKAHGDAAGEKIFQIAADGLPVGRCFARGADRQQKGGAHAAAYQRDDGRGQGDGPDEQAQCAEHGHGEHKAQLGGRLILHRESRFPGKFLPM